MLAPELAIASALAVPAVGAALIAWADRAPNLRESITLVTAVALLGCVLTLLPMVSGGARPALTLFSLLPGLQIAFRVEPLGRWSPGATSWSRCSARAAWAGCTARGTSSWASRWR